MINRICAVSIVAVLTATPVAAGDFLYMSDPGLCDAPDGVTELLDTTFLSAHSIGNHYFECTWDEDLAQITASGNWPEVTASCQNATESWTQNLGFYPQDESNLDYPLKYPVYLSVWFDQRGMMPVKFYQCGDANSASENLTEATEQTTSE